MNDFAPMGFPMNDFAPLLGNRRMNRPARIGEEL